MAELASFISQCHSLSARVKWAGGPHSSQLNHIQSAWARAAIHPNPCCCVTGLVSSESPWVHHLIGNHEHCLEGMVTTFRPLPELPIEFYLKILSSLQPISSSKYFWTTSSGVTAMPSPPTIDCWCCFPLRKYQHKWRACKGHRLLAHGFGELSSQAAGSILLGLTTSCAPRHTSSLTSFNWPQQLHAKLAKC